MNRQPSSQRGVALVVSLLMLVVLTLFVITAMNSSLTNLRIVGNQQLKKEGAAAAQRVLEEIITKDFSANPAGVAGNYPVDINKDGTADFNVAVTTPICLNAVPIRNIDLNTSDANDVSCFASSAATSSGIAGVPTSGNSLCSNTVWDIPATATDSGGLGSTVILHQGAAQRVVTGTTC